MKKEDMEYLCTTIGNLAGIPVRIYKKGQKTFYHSIVDLPRDPIFPCEKNILSVDEHIGYFVTPRFYYFGVVNSGEYKIVLGPSRQMTESEQELKGLAFECDVDPDDTEKFVSSMKNLVVMPLNSILQTLCSVNFVLNGEKLSLTDITIYDEEQGKLTDRLEAENTERNYESDFESLSDKNVHNTLALEQTIMNFIRHGDSTALKAWLRNAPAVRSGIIASDAIRQMKNTFIVTTALASRAAIRGGVDVETALSLSDVYIQKCELLNSIEAIENLQYHMVFDFTERVEKLRFGKTPTKLAAAVANYTLKHLSEPIDVEALSKSLFITRTYLAAKFKKETGMTLTEFIMREKIEEGKRLLRYTDKPVAAIAAYLGFSSQSHFSNVFKRYANFSPNEYRLKNAKQTHYNNR